MDESMQRALEIAGELIDAGVPVFAAPPCPAANGGTCGRDGHAGGGQEYDLPPKWQFTIPTRTWLDRWQPGWALAAVGGHACDFLDEDPRNGGEASITQLEQAGFPRVFGVQNTPSGGRHYLISPARERKSVGFLPGLDYQGGASDGRGRGFVWIAPTVKRSKTDGVLRAYVWTQEPDMDFLGEFNGDGFTDDSLDILIGFLAAKKTERVKETVRPSGVQRTFSYKEAESFINGQALDRVRTAEIGQIEEITNAAACSLSHFVPSMYSIEQAFDMLADALGETAYDTTHPASSWTVEKFHGVLAGEAGRAPGDWIAVHTPETLEEAQAAVTGDDVSALLAEMLPFSIIGERVPPRYMVKGMLTYDSTAWLIGGPGSKKSFVALDIAGHVALGKDWQGRKVNRGVVIIIAGEGAGSLGKRVSAWQKKYEPMPDDAIRVLPRPVQSAEPEKWAVLVEACRRLRANLDPALGMLIIVDTQARSTVGLEENSAKEMGIYVKAVDAIKSATRGCVLSVHHTGKVGTGTRGSSSLDGAQDTRLLMESKPGTLEGRLSIRKQKDLDEGDPIELRFEKVDVGLDADGEPLDSLVLKRHDAWMASEMGDEALDEAGQGRDDRFVIPEPQDWTKKFFPYRNQDLVRRILQAASVTGQVGRTEAQVKKLVQERWYPRGFGRGKDQLRNDNPNAGWDKAWANVIEFEQDEERLMVNPAGSAARWMLNETLIKWSNTGESDK